MRTFPQRVLIAAATCLVSMILLILLIELGRHLFLSTPPTEWLDSSETLTPSIWSWLLPTMGDWMVSALFQLWIPVVLFGLLFGGFTSSAKVRRSLPGTLFVALWSALIVTLMMRAACLTALPWSPFHNNLKLQMIFYGVILLSAVLSGTRVWAWERRRRLTLRR